MKKLLPVILILVGLIGGIAAGAVLRPAPEPACEEGAEPCPEESHENPHAAPDPALQPTFDPEKPTEFVKMPKQFVVPIIKRDRVSALVVLSISLEVDAGTADAVFAREPRLRDAFLQVLFAHANSGGFDGAFTTGQSMNDLRGKLMQEALRNTAQVIHEVLITDLVKQAV